MKTQIFVAGQMNAEIFLQINAEVFRVLLGNTLQRY